MQSKSERGYKDSSLEQNIPCREGAILILKGKIVSLHLNIPEYIDETMNKARPTNICFDR